MKPLFLFLTLLFFYSHAQLPDIHFSDGRWRLDAYIDEGDPEELQDLKNFQLTDTAAIRELLRGLALVPDTTCTGFSHFTNHLALLHNGKEVLSIGMLVSAGKVSIYRNDTETYYSFDRQWFLKKIRRYKELPVTDVIIHKRLDLLRFHRWLSTEENKWMSVDLSGDNWQQYSGYFVFEANYYTPPYPKAKPVDQEKANKARFYIQMELLKGSYYIDLPDSLQAGEIPEEEFAYEDSVRNYHEALILQKARENLGDTALHKMQICSWDYSHNPNTCVLQVMVSCEEETARNFSAYPLVKEWKLYSDVDVRVYGMTMKEINRWFEKNRGK